VRTLPQVRQGLPGDSAQRRAEHRIPRLQSKVVSGYDEALTAEVCRDCLICIEHCPTGALGRPVKV